MSQLGLYQTEERMGIILAVKAYTVHQYFELLTEKGTRCAQVGKYSASMHHEQQLGAVNSILRYFYGAIICD